MESVQLLSHHLALCVNGEQSAECIRAPTSRGAMGLRYTADQLVDPLGLFLDSMPSLATVASVAGGIVAGVAVGALVVACAPAVVAGATIFGIGGAIFDYFGRSNVDSIKGNWQYDTNLNAFNDGIARGLTPEQAAAEGFSHVEITQSSQNAQGIYQSVKVRFTRSLKRRVENIVSFDQLTKIAKKSDDVDFLRGRVAAGATFSEAVNLLVQRRSLEPSAPPLFLADVFATAFHVHPAECSIFGGWFPGGEGPIDDARLEETLADVVVEFSTDAELVRRIIARAYVGYAYDEATTHFLIAERRSDGREAVRILSMECKNRKLVVEYRRTASWLGDGAVRRIAFHAIICDLSGRAYDGNADHIVWKNLDGSPPRTEPYVVIGA